MAGIKNSFSKGLVTLNVKTSNFMEENKLKTSISTQEEEIRKMKLALGDTVYRNWEKGSLTLEMLNEQMEAIREKYQIIEEIQKQIEELAEKERQILGENTADESDTGKLFCDQCGTRLAAGSRFCKKCGNKVAD